MPDTEKPSVYDILKENWENDKVALQKSRREINDKRNKIYKDYNELKNGFQELNSSLTASDEELPFANASVPEQEQDPIFDTYKIKVEGGTRKKQDRERAELYTNIDNKLKQARAHDDPKESWSKRNVRVKSERQSHDQTRIADLHAKISTIEKEFEEYRILSKQYYRDYYTILQTKERSEYLDPERRSDYDTAAFEQHQTDKIQYQSILENQIEQDRIFAEMVWEDMRNMRRLAAENLQSRQQEQDESLRRQRQEQRQDTIAYNEAYWQVVRSNRTEADREKKTTRKTHDQHIKDIRKSEDAERLSWSQYRASVTPKRKENDNIDAKFFAKVFASIRAKASHFRGMDIAKTSIKALWEGQLALNTQLFKTTTEKLKEIHNFFLKKISSYTLMPIKERLQQYRFFYNQVIIKTSPKFIQEYKDSMEFWRKFKEAPPATDTTTKTDSNKSSENLKQSRKEFYAEYDAFISKFFATWNENEIRIRKASKDAEIAIYQNRKQKNQELNAVNEAKHIAYRKLFATAKGYEIDERGIRSFKKDEAQIQTMIAAAKTNPELAAAVRNKKIAVAIKKTWYNVNLALSNTYYAVSNLSDTLSSGIYGVRNSGTYIYYRLRNGASAAYFLLRRGAYAAYATDRYVLRPIWHYGIVDSVNKSISVFKYIFKNLLTRLEWAIRRSIVLGTYFVGNLLFTQIFYGVLIASQYILVYSANFVMVGILWTFNTIALLYERTVAMLRFPLIILADIAALSIYGIANALFYVIGSLAITTASILTVTLATLIASISYILEVPVSFILTALAKFSLQAVTLASRTIQDSLVFTYLIIRKIDINISRIMYDIGVVIARGIIDIATFVGRRTSDLAHIIKENVYDNVLVFGLQSIQDLATNVSRTIGSAVTTLNMAITQFRFATYVALSALALRVSYAFGLVSKEAVYYSGRLVVNTSRFGSDKYKVASETVNQVITPAQEKLNKFAANAKYVAVTANTNIVRLADDYIGYPIHYAYHNAGIALPRAAWDGYINLWRGVQGVCTSGIRGFHDVVLDTKHNVATKATNFGYAAAEGAVNAKHNAIKASHVVREGLESLNIAGYFDKNADELFAKYQKNAAENENDGGADLNATESRNRPGS